MKTKYTAIAALTLLGAFASCQKENLRPDNAVKVSVSVGALTKTNAIATDDTQRQFNQGDQISVSTNDQEAVIFQCTSTENQTWTETVAGKFLLWTQPMLTFSAYYPVTTGTSMTAFTMPADQSSEAKIALADYMTRQQVISRPEGGSDIQMQLERKMARVIVRISSFGSQYDDDEKTVSNVRIYSEASGIEDNDPTGSSTEIQPYAQGDGGQGSTYTALVVPGYGDSGARFIQLTDGESSTLLVKGIPELEAGYSYTFNLTVGKNTIQVQSVTVTDWTGETLTGGQAEEAPSGPGVTTFSELQTALSAGKDVKLMNDIDCTEEISITSNGALTIDGNGKTLSTTSAIRAFKVGSSATVAFKNLTITGFVNGGGPAINNEGTIVLDGCTISNCHVNNSNGGGAIESSGKLYAVNTTFSGNYSGEIGGAINNYWGSLYMTDCTFTDNYTTDSHAYYGGAIGINGGDEVRLINCSFSENKYGTTAGTNDIGVYNKSEKYTIAGCTGATIAARADVGDITTIASGTATLDYSDLSNISFTYTAPDPASATDLATITANYEAKDGETLTGTLASNVKISIADGATVTLKDVNINGSGTWTSGNYAGITCAGDATITLEGTNTVKGFAEKYPGIFVSSGKTLIINGTGELNASSNGSADNGSGGAGIGGGYEMNCGNIEIQSGTVTATGNKLGAGIGGGYNASCGNITISGGTVTATGGNNGAGIGGGKRFTANVSCGNITISGGTVNATGGEGAAGIGGGKGNNNSYKSSCGTITITTGVTSVTATKGSGANSIGAGKNGTCGSVTIEDSSKVTQK